MENKSFCLRLCILVIRRIVWKYRLIDSRFWSFAIRSEMGHWLFFHQQKRLDSFTLFKNHFSSVTQKSRLNITMFTNDSMRGCKDGMEILATTHAAFSSHSVWLTIFQYTHTNRTKNLLISYFKQRQLFAWHAHENPWFACEPELHAVEWNMVNEFAIVLNVFYISSLSQTEIQMKFLAFM